MLGIPEMLSLEREIKALSILSGITSRTGALKDNKNEDELDPTKVYYSGHPNIVRYFETYHGPTSVHLVTECYPLDLFDFMNKFKSRMSESVSSCILREICDGLAHMHSNGICHRDLKPENILVALTSSDVSVKICDFGSCAFLTAPQPAPSAVPPPDTIGAANPSYNAVSSGARGSMLSEFSGSPGFFAPEMLLQPTYCGYKADVFSFGCLALELLTSPTFFNNNWVSAYNCLGTASAPDFSQLLNEAREVSLRFKDIFLYTVGILCHVEWCIRQLWCFSIILYNITSIAYNHHTDICPLINIYI